MTKTHDRHGPGQAGEDARLAESRAILKRVRQETEPQIGAGSAGIMTDMRAHFAGRDADPADPIEVLGTRIGRLLGLLGVVVLAVLLAVQLLSG